MGYFGRGDLQQTMSADFSPFQRLRDPGSSKNGSFLDARGFNEK